MWEIWNEKICYDFYPHEISHVVNGNEICFQILYMIWIVILSENVSNSDDGVSENVNDFYGHVIYYYDPVNGCCDPVNGSGDLWNECVDLWTDCGPLTCCCDLLIETENESVSSV